MEREKIVMFSFRNTQPRPGIAETEGKAAMGSGERAMEATEFQSPIGNR
jgi:hypothetical protein